MSEESKEKIRVAKHHLYSAIKNIEDVRGNDPEAFKKFNELTNALDCAINAWQAIRYAT